MLKLFAVSLLIAFQSYVYSFENTHTMHVNEGRYAYPKGIQEYFNNEITTHNDIENLNIVTSQWSDPVDLYLLSHLNKIKSLNISASGGWVFGAIPSTIPHIPTLLHFGITPYYISKETFEKLNWINLNPQIESLDLKDVYFEENIDNPLFPFTQLNNLKKIKLNVDFRNKNVKFATLNLFPSLKFLYFTQDCLISDEDLLVILNLPKLEELYLEKSKRFCQNDLFIHRKIFDQLTTSYNLRILFLKNVLLDDVDFSHFAPNLKVLALDRAKLSTDWRKLQANQGLETLELFSMEFNPYSLEQINLVSLRNVKIFRSNSAGGVDISSFVPNAKELYLNNSNITGEDLQKIGQMRSLEILDISNTSINGSSLNYIGSLQGLKKLYANNLSLRKSDIIELAKLTSLEELSLSGTDLSIDQIEKLGQFSSLKLLDLSHLPNNNITSVEIEVLRKKLPHTRIIFDSN